MNEILSAALRYLEGGFCPIPMNRETKRPAIPWKPYQSRLPSEDEVREWFSVLDPPGIGIVCGAVSGGLLVVDVDDLTGGWPTPDQALTLDGPRVSTPRGGYHVWLRTDQTLGNTVSQLAPGIDTRGNAGVVVAPPTCRPDGTAYAWQTPAPKTVEDLPEVPRWLLDALQTQPPATEDAPTNNYADLLTGVEAGQRNDAAARIVGHLLAAGVERAVIDLTMTAWNAKNRPPLPAEELNAVVTSIARRELLKAGSETTDATLADRDHVFSVIRERFKIDLDDISHVDGDLPYYVFVVAGCEATLRAGKMDSETAWRRTIIEAAHRTPKRLPRNADPGWWHYANLMMAVAREVDVGEDGRLTGHVDGWITDYLEAHPPISPAEMKQKGDTIILDGGLIGLHPPSFRRWLNRVHDVRLKAPEFSQILARRGYTEKRAIWLKTKYRPKGVTVRLLLVSSQVSEGCVLKKNQQELFRDVRM